jgi:hypothetical protein
VLGAGRDSHDVSGLDLTLLPRDDSGPDPADEAQDLVVLVVHLLADLPARRDRHDHQLGVLAGPQDPAEVGALLGHARDLEVLHALALPAEDVDHSPRAGSGGRAPNRAE